MLAIPVPDVKDPDVREFVSRVRCQTEEWLEALKEITQ
jgi:hypothetical protein